MKPQDLLAAWASLIPSSPPPPSPSPSPPPPATTPTTLTFDDLPAPSGLGPLPKTYHNLTFSTYSIFNPHSPNLAHLISPQDYNCAVSPSNALLGSRPFEGSPVGATFGIPHGLKDSDSSRSGGGEDLEDVASFTLCGFWIKPLISPPPGARITVLGYRRRRRRVQQQQQQGGRHKTVFEQLPSKPSSRQEEEEEQEQADLKWHVYFTHDYHLPLHVRMEEFSREKWDGLIEVEIRADFGEDGDVGEGKGERLDWEFCLDDLVVIFE